MDFGISQPCLTSHWFLEDRSLKKDQAMQNTLWKIGMDDDGHLKYHINHIIISTSPCSKQQWDGWLGGVFCCFWWEGNTGDQIQSSTDRNPIVRLVSDGPRSGSRWLPHCVSRYEDQPTNRIGVVTVRMTATNVRSGDLKMANSPVKIY